MPSFELPSSCGQRVKGRGWPGVRTHPQLLTHPNYRLQPNTRAARAEGDTEGLAGAQGQLSGISVLPLQPLSPRLLLAGLAQSPGHPHPRPTGSALTGLSSRSCSFCTVSFSFASCSWVVFRSSCSLVAARPRSPVNFFSFSSLSCGQRVEGDQLAHDTQDGPLAVSVGPHQAQEDTASWP